MWKQILLFLYFGNMVLGCAFYHDSNRSSLPSPILKTNSGKVVESVLGNVILHPQTQEYHRFRCKQISSENPSRHHQAAQGVEVSWVSPALAALKTLEVGDRIVGAYSYELKQESPIETLEQLQYIMSEYLFSGLEFSVIKANHTSNNPEVVQISTAHEPEEMDVVACEQAWETTFLGVGFANLEKLPKLDRPKHLYDNTVVLHWVSSDTLAGRLGLFPMDAVLEIDGQKINTCLEAIKQIEKHQGQGVVRFKVRHPDSRVETIEVPLGTAIDEVLLERVPAVYGHLFSQQEEAYSFLGYYNSTRYFYCADPQNRSISWDLKELTKESGDILYQPQPEYFQEQYVRFPLIYNSIRTTSLKSGKGRETQHILKFIRVDKEF